MLSVDLSSQSTQFLFELLVLLHVFATWHGNLDENYLVFELRVVVKESVESFQLLSKALDVVESVDAYNDRDTLVPFFQGVDAFLDIWLCKSLCEFLGVNSDNELVCTDQTILILDLMSNLGACTTDEV